MKICVVTPRFTIAGVPLAQLRFSRALADKGHDVTLVIGRIDVKHELPEVVGVKVIKWDCRNVRTMLLPLYKFFREEQPEVIFTAEDHLNVIVLLAALMAGSKAKISCSSRVTPYDTYSNIPFSKRWVLKQLMRAVMWRADALTCVSTGTVEEYRNVFKSAPHVCVYNIVDDPHSRLKMTETVDHQWLTNKKAPVLVAAGRLASWKGYADLIRAMAELIKRRDARLLILGDGPLRAELEALVIELDLSDFVDILGYVDNPLAYFARADVFAHSAYVESLGNVLVEAMMCGCTPVSTDCPTGPREVLQGGKYGYLVPMHDPKAMAAGIDRALDHPIPKALLDEAVLRFEEGAIIARHFEVLGLEDKDFSQESVL
ncbi:MAG: glycosyltransferase [Halioglobus sp.]